MAVLCLREVEFLALGWVRELSRSVGLVSLALWIAG